MKKIYVSCVTLLTLYLSTTLHSQIVESDELRRHEGEKVTVCEIIAGTYLTKKERPTIFLNFGKPYPNQLFVGVIFNSNIAKFPYDPVKFLKNKHVCISGEVKLYRGKLEIIINDPSQLKIKKTATKKQDDNI